MTEVFQNSIDAIIMGIEDFESSDSKRQASAVRNFYSGVLLLGKACLLNAAPNADPREVIASKLTPIPDNNGGITYKISGQSTVDVQGLKQRFKDFNLVWPSGELKNLQKLRNDIEHFHSNESEAQIQEVITKCFPLVEGFFKILNVDPSVVLEEAWVVILRAKKDFQEQKDICNLSFENMPWFKDLFKLDRISCDMCSSSLILQRDKANADPAEIKATCLTCRYDSDAKQTVEMIVDAEKFDEDYISIKDSGEPIIHNCPECFNNTYIRDGEIDLCFFCSNVIDGDCYRCGAPLEPADGNGSLCCSCQFCWQKMEKE